MARIITKLLILLLFGLNVNAQKFFFANNFVASGGGGSNVTIVGTPDYQFNNTGATVHSLTSVPAGARLVISAAAGSGTSLNANVTSSPSLTWTKVADATYGANSGDAEIHIATFTAGGSITITSNYGSVGQSSVAYTAINQESSAGGASATAANQSLPSVTLTTTRTNSIIIAVTADWSAVDGSGRSYRLSPVQTGYHFQSGAYTGYHYYKVASTITDYIMGLTAPNMATGASTALYELRGN